MSKEPEATVRVEIVPPAPRSGPAEVAAQLKKFIESEVARVLANREDFVFQPFLQEKKISDEIRRMQNVAELRKWSIYFEKFGCLICGDRKTTHTSCGMCSGCYRLVYNRLRLIVKQYRTKSEEYEAHPVDRADLARQALAGPVRALPAAPSQRGRPKGQKAGKKS